MAINVGILDNFAGYRDPYLQSQHQQPLSKGLNLIVLEVLSIVRTEEDK